MAESGRIDGISDFVLPVDLGHVLVFLYLVCLFGVDWSCSRTSGIITQHAVNLNKRAGNRRSRLETETLRSLRSLRVKSTTPRTSRTPHEKSRSADPERGSALSA